jgi:hypothetical protein
MLVGMAVLDETCIWNGLMRKYNVMLYDYDLLHSRSFDSKSNSMLAELADPLSLSTKLCLCTTSIGEF